MIATPWGLLVECALATSGALVLAWALRWQWIFNPAFEDGKPVSAPVRVPEDFSPDGPPSTPGTGAGPDRS